jgi:small subunit ribosomal protein S17
MKKKLKGTVKNRHQEKTAVVIVDRLKVHPKYKKRIKVSKSYQVHTDIKVEAGDRVEIEAIRPMSRHKHFKISKVIKK